MFSGVEQKDEMPLTPIQKRNVVQFSIGSLAILIGLCVVS